MKINLPIVINSEISLRALEKNDAESISKYANNKAIWNCVRDFFPHPYTVEHAKSFITLNPFFSPCEKLAICYNNKVIGIISITLQADTLRNSAELGYWLGQDFWGNRILSNTLPKAIAYFWGNFDYLNRIFASVHHNNIASCKLLLANGFIQEGFFKQSVFKNNIYLDEVRFGLLKA